MTGFVFAAGVLLGVFVVPAVFFLVVFWREYRLAAESRREAEQFARLTDALRKGTAND